MPIRIPNIPDVQGTAINAPQMSFAAANAPNAALTGIAQAVAGAGGHFQSIADDLQKAQNAEMVSKKLMDLKTGHAQLLIDLQNDPDPVSRMTKHQQWLEGQKGAMAEGPPAVQDELRGRFDTFAGNAHIQQVQDSASLQKKRTGLQFSNELNTAFESGDESGAYDAISRAGASGQLLPEEVEALNQKTKSQFAIRAVEKQIDASPLETEKALNDPDYLKNNPGVSVENLQRLQRQADIKANRYRSDFSDELIINGAIPTEADLEAMENAGQIDKNTHAQWIVKLRNEGKAPVSDPAIYNEVYGQVMNYDSAKDANGRTEATIRGYIASQNLPPEELKQLNSKLSERVNPVTSKKPRNIYEADFAKKISEDFTSGDFGAYRFPLDHDNDPATAPKIPKNKAEYDKAWNLMGEFSDAWRGILATMPEDVQFPAVNAAYEALKSTFKDKKPAPELDFAPRRPLPFAPDAIYKNLSGVKTSFGGIPVNPPGIPYTGAGTTVFGGKNDPADNGRSALDGPTGEGGREGAAIPQDLLKSKFPGKDKEWIAENVSTVVKTLDGISHALSIADFGTAEWVWQEKKRPTLDLTEGAVKQLGGKVVYTPAGKLSSVAGLDNVTFSVVSTDVGGAKLQDLNWNDAKQAWFSANKPTSNTQIENSLIALRQKWTLAQAAKNKP